MMKLEVLNNNFIEIEDLIKVLNVNCNLNEYIYENGILKGEFEFEGEYVNDSSSFDKPFNLLAIEFNSSTRVCPPALSVISSK